MKKIAFIFISSLLIVTACKKDVEPVFPSNNQVSNQITEQEKTDLLFIREEEKLARDVYIYAYNKYGHTSFNNISNSEQKHMNSVLSLLDKYGIPDPVGNNEAGVFVNPTLQALYNELTSACNDSLAKAFEVGANIEDLDIRDLNILKTHTTKADLLNLYDNLACGSGSHLRSFVSQLGSYTPLYISQSEYEAIISSPHVKCGK